MTLQIVRPDRLPENAQYYSDKGCHVAPACLECPLPSCVHDQDADVLRARRDAMILRWRKRGIPNREIARALNTSTRSIDRALERGRTFVSPQDSPGTDPASIPPLIHARKPWPVIPGTTQQTEVVT